MVRCSFLDTLAIASMYIFSFIFSSNVSHSQGNQRNSIIKQWKKIELLLFFLLSKNNKKPDGLCMGSSSNLNTKRSEVPQSNISTYPCSDVPSFSKVFEICYNQTVLFTTVDLQDSSQGYILSYFLKLCKALSFSVMVVKFSLACIFHHAWEKISNLWCSLS